MNKPSKILPTKTCGGVMQFLEKHEKDILFPEKFLASHKDSILQKIQHLHEQSAALSIKDALFEILKEIPDKVPAEMLIELTRFAIEQLEARSFLNEGVAAQH